MSSPSARPTAGSAGRSASSASLALRRAAVREWWILTLLLTLLAAVLGGQNGLGRIDHTLYDATLSRLGRSPSADIVIVAIDEASLEKFGRWPWPRGVHAALLDRISAAKPRAIAFDLILTEPEPGGGDDLFAAAIGQSASGVAPSQPAPQDAPTPAPPPPVPTPEPPGPAPDASAPAAAKLPATLPATPPARPAVPVVLAVLMEPAAKGTIKTSLPVPSLTAAASSLGHIHVELDDDGLARSVFLLEGLVEADPRKNATWPHFALAALEAGLPSRAGQALPGERNPNQGGTPGAWRRDYWIRIPFAGPPGTYTQVSYADVLRGAVPAAALAGKFVLVGATAAGLGDAYATPVSGRGRAMAGIEIHANVIDALLGGRALVRAPPLGNALASAVIVLAAMLGLRRWSPRRGLLLIALMMCAVLVACWALLATAQVWFAPAACLTALLAAYPLWSWRRLEAAMRFIGDEFRRIQSEPAILPAPAAGKPGGVDILDQRFAALEAAATQLRDTRRFVADTLNSHPDGILVADTRGGILLANRAAAAVFGMAVPEDLHGRDLVQLMRYWTDRSGNPATGLWEFFTAGAAPAAALELTTPDERNLLAHSARGASADGATLGWIISLINVTALRTAEARRDEALAFLSHDMRSPQSSILALLELHALDPDNHPLAGVHERIEGYVRKTLDLSEQFLQVSRAETKAYELEPVDARELCSEAIDDTWEAASKKHIKLSLQTHSAGGKPQMLAADRSLLARAIGNLLSNAVKYSPEHTVVTVTVTVATAALPVAPQAAGGAAATCLSIEVADQGYGISEADQQQLFTRYRRFSTPGQPKAAGAGLGMVFVKTVTEQHGGRVEFDSVPGRGTRFRLLLPTAPD